MNNDLKIIKKKYGEDMMHFCRENFSSLLETEGLLSELLMDHFDPSHILYDDIVSNALESDFKNYIYSLVAVENNNEIIVNKTPKELLSDAGYNLFECTTEEEIQNFKKYYASGEELCTFSDNRLQSCRVFFAVKKDVDNIKREDFKNPNRQDLYGTSVISIQFTKDETNTLSIKNRYNHTVNNPDATFSNNLDNIIPGLTKSFENTYGIVQKHKGNAFEIPNYVQANDGKYYKYNYEINNIYYCPNNIIIDNFEVNRYDKSRYLIIDYFIIDMSKDNKSISLYDKSISDSFCDVMKEIKKIEIDNIDDGKKIKILGINDEYLEILIDKDGKIISLKMDNVCEIGDKFLYKNVSLRELYLPKLTTVGNDFLCCNSSLQNLNLPKLTTVGNDFLYFNDSLQELCVPNLIKVGNSFLWKNVLIEEINLPELEVVGNCFLLSNTSLKRIELPSLMKVGDKFLFENVSLRELYMPKLTVVGDEFLYRNTFRGELNLSNLEVVGDSFMLCNDFLQELYVPNLITVGYDFLYNNVLLHKLHAPKLTKVGNRFLYNNLSLSKLHLPSLKMTYDKFLYYNESLQELYVPELQNIGDDFLFHNESLQELYVPNLATVGDYFLFLNKVLRNKILSEIILKNRDNERGRR